MKTFHNIPKFVLMVMTLIYIVPFLFDTPGGELEFIWFIYLFPPMFFAYYYGLKGGLISGCIAVFLQAFWEIRLYLLFEEFEEENFIHLIIIATTLFAGALGVGLLADKLHKNQNRLEKVNEELKTAYHEMENMAYHDMLTGLPNRKLFEDLLIKAIADANCNDTLSAVIYIDLDKFKYVNDTMGHAIGDHLVKKVADRLKLCIRPGDTVARLGGDEFTVIINNMSNYEDFRVEANKIHLRLQEPFNLGDNEILITSSIGVSIYPIDGIDSCTLMKYADLAMYKAKDKGRNGVQFYTPEMNKEVERRDYVEKQMRKALDLKQFIIHYQPQIHVSTKKVFGMEALLRWNHPDVGLIPPNEFIPIAEEMGHIIEIGKWVLKTACMQAKDWSYNTGISLKLSVNISAIQLRNSSFISMVKQTLDETNFDPRNLVLEITEGVTVDGLEGVIAKLWELKKMGVQIAIDDFGTGYSSLSYLRKLPVSILKIDRFFVQGISKNNSEKVLIDAIITLAKEIGIETIAEGVETIEELEYLRKKECDVVQGYFLCHPIPGEEFIKFIGATNCMKGVIT